MDSPRKTFRSTPIGCIGLGRQKPWVFLGVPSYRMDLDLGVLGVMSPLSIGRGPPFPLPFLRPGQPQPLKKLLIHDIWSFNRLESLPF